MYMKGWVPGQCPCRGRRQEGSTAQARPYCASARGLALQGPAKLWRTGVPSLGSCPCPSRWSGQPLLPWGWLLGSRVPSSALGRDRGPRPEGGRDTGLNPSKVGLEGAVSGGAGMVSVRNGRAAGDPMAIFVWEGAGTLPAFRTWPCGRRQLPGSEVADTGAAGTELLTI